MYINYVEYLIPLSRSLCAIVDAEDYDWLMYWKWSAKERDKTGTFYAVRGEAGTTIQMARQIMGLYPGDPVRLIT